MFRLLAIAVFLNSLALTLAPARTFTSADGKKLEADIVGADETTVTLRRATDKRDFKLPIARLSDADRTFIAAWLKRNFHPLGWKRLRIHGDGRNLAASCLPIYGPDRRQSNGTMELVLPVGAWVNLQILELGTLSYPGFVRFDGASDWYVSGDGPLLMVKRGEEGQEIIASVAYSETHAKGNGFSPTAESAIKRGASVSTFSNRRAVPLLPETAATALHVLFSEGAVPKWSRLPEKVRVLHLAAQSEAIDFDGIEKFADLEHLEVTAKSLQGLEHLAPLKKLRSLFLKAESWNGAEHAHLEMLPKLRHLALINHNSDNLNSSHYEFLQSLPALESLATTERYRPKPTFSAEHLARCANLTRIDARVKSGAQTYLKQFKKLTDVSFFRFDQKASQELIASGHFKSVHTIRECGTEIDLAQFPALRTLQLGSTTPKSASGTAQLPSVERLDVRCSDQGAFESLCQHPFVSSVRHLSFSEQMPADLAPLRAFSNLISLEFDRAKNSTSTSSLNLDRFPNLRSVHAAYSSLDTITGLGGIEALRVHGIALKALGNDAPTKLKCLDLSKVNELANLDGVKNSPDLRFLHLYLCPQLASHSGLADLENLKEFHISHCKMPKAGVQP